MLTSFIPIPCVPQILSRATLNPCPATETLEFIIVKPQN